MTFNTDTTIAAIATARGTGGVAIIRLSGPESWAIAQTLTSGEKSWSPGVVAYDWLQDPETGSLIDEVLFLPFKGPKSFTGEDCVEIHCHGGLALSKTMLALCLKHGARAAEAGEFTRRAVMNGRIDLTQAEAVLDLIHAQGEALIKLSANNLRHRTVGKALENYLAQISKVQADLTASIDFPDEVDEPARLPLADDLEELRSQITRQLTLSANNRFIRDGIEIALLGRPNAGKSSLFNALLTTDRSIVTDIAGTTRDVIRETLSIKGIPVTLVDTAGLRETGDTVEILGVERSWQALEGSQAVIYVLDGAEGITPEDHAVFEKLRGKPGLVVLNKSDAPGFVSLSETGLGWPVLSVSAQSGKNVESVMAWLEEVTENLPDSQGLDALLSERQIQHLSQVSQSLQTAAQTLADPHMPLDLATVPLTDALLELQGLLGKDTVEVVLDSVFARFCVGK